MTRQKREISLMDSEGFEWVRANLTPASVKRIVKEFARFEIYLEEVSA